MSLFGTIEGFYYNWKNKFMWFNLYRKTFRNYPSVITNQSRTKFPLKAIFKNGKQLMMNSIDETALFALLTAHKNMTYDEKNDLLTISPSSEFNRSSVRLYGIIQNTDTLLAFSQNNSTYENLPLQDKTIIDIGACTGDTSIYFALKGAKKVIAVEPFPKNFEILEKNILENNFDNLIIPILAACGSSNKEISIDPNNHSGMRSILHEYPDGFKISMITLEQIIADYDVSNAILKLDCEGCEYEIILNSLPSILKKFTDIQIEYHDGYKNLEEKLLSVGFEVSHPIIDNVNRGHIHAKRKT
ncbi:MAG: FkbM family methyltransferase [Lutibacter sp.]|nr:FkbM family methyltransferase [Lutibacter sp.]